MPPRESSGRVSRARSALACLLLAALVACADVAPSMRTEPERLGPLASGSFSGGSIGRGSVIGTFSGEGVQSGEERPYFVQMTVQGVEWYECVDEHGTPTLGELPFRETVTEPLDGHVDEAGSFEGFVVVVDGPVPGDGACTAPAVLRRVDPGDPESAPLTFTQVDEVQADLIDSQEVEPPAEGELRVAAAPAGSQDTLAWLCDDPEPSAPLADYDSPPLDGADAVCTLVDGPGAPPAGRNALLLSSTSGGSVAGVAFADEDILAFDLASETWSLLFDGSRVGIGSADINAFHFEDDGAILMSFRSGEDVPGLGEVEDNDVIRFTPDTPWDFTRGSFHMVLDGSDVGLDTSAEDINALAVTADGTLLVSLNGDFRVPGAGGILTGVDEDLLAFHPQAWGPTTRGTWSLVFDGSDVGLSSSGEDVYGLALGPAGDLLLTSKSDFEVPGLRGDKETVYSFAPTRLGETTRGSFAAFWDGVRHGFADERIDGLDLVDLPSSAAF